MPEPQLAARYVGRPAAWLAGLGLQHSPRPPDSRPLGAGSELPKPASPAAASAAPACSQCS